MNGEEILGSIMMIFCGFGCGALFSWIGGWAASRKDPMHFWTGSTVDPNAITDIPAYNQANSRMWKQYAWLYWLAGICGVLSFLDIRFSVLAGIVISLACTVGIWWLIHTYKKIEKRYKVQNP